MGQRWWDELSDDELLHRLLARGVHPMWCGLAVLERDHDQDLRAAIDVELGAEP